MNKICEQVRDLLAHDRGNLNFSPASRYAVSKLCDYAAQEHEQREKAETIFCNERRKALAFSAEMVANEKEDIGAQPVRVTRCKDCRFWQGVGDNGSCCTGAGIDDFTDADDYCSRGRKANGASCRER